MNRQTARKDLWNIPAGERGRYLNGAVHADEMRTGERDRSAESVKRRKCRLVTETSYYPKNYCGSHRFSLIRSDPIIQDGHISITHIYGTSGDQCLITSRLPVSARMSERKAWPSSTTVRDQTPSGALPGFGLLNCGPHAAPGLPYRGSENCPHRKTLCTYFNKKHYGNNSSCVNKIWLTHRNKSGASTQHKSQQESC